jgi:hypothetical protein
MTNDSERERDAEPAGEVSEASAVLRRRPRTRVVSEAVAAALSDRPPRPRTRVMAEAVVAAIPAEAGAEPGGGGDGDEGAGA